MGGGGWGGVCGGGGGDVGALAVGEEWFVVSFLVEGGMALLEGRSDVFWWMASVVFDTLLKCLGHLSF